MSSSSSSTEDDFDAVLIAMQSLEISKDSLWPAFVYTSKEDKEQVIAKLDECFVPPECYTWLPFPKPQSKDESIENHMLAKALSIVAQLPLFSIFSIATPSLMLMSSGTPCRMKINDCDDAIAHLRHIYNEDYLKHGGGILEFSKLSSSRIIMDQLKKLQLNRMAHEHTASISAKQFSHSWPKHTSTFSALHLYNVMIITILSLAAVNGKSDEEHERLNACHRRLDEQLGELFQEYMREDAMHAAVAFAHRQLESRSNVYDLVVPQNLIGQMRSYTYRVLELFERCVMSMIEIPDRLQDKLVCTCQKRLPHDEELSYATYSLIEEQSHVFNARCESNPRIWTFNRKLSEHSATELLYRRRPYHEWIMTACIRYTQNAQAIKKHLDYQRRVVLGTTTHADNDWSSTHVNFDEKTNSIFRVVH